VNALIGLQQQLATPASADREKGDTAMLAEIFILRIENAIRDADGQTCPSRDKRFVPIKLPVNHMTNRAYAERAGRMSQA
jgi:hypothetical protein